MSPDLDELADYIRSLIKAKKTFTVTDVNGEEFTIEPGAASLQAESYLLRIVPGLDTTLNVRHVVKIEILSIDE